MLSCVRRTQLRILKQQAAYSASLIRGKSTNTDDEIIEIPDRIQRGPTDILRTLALSVGRDPTAAHFKYHDDPYLIPTSNIGKRTFALAQEAGRKAARWVRQEHPDLFMHSEADPPIKAFAPQMVFTEDSEVDETSLRTLIRDIEVTDAIFVYNLMKTKGIPIDNSLKHELLELVCFYNHEDTLSDEFIEERWFSQSSLGRERHRKTWKDGEVSEQIFNEIEPKTAQTYSTLIRGMCKYFQVDRAWALFNEAQEKGLQLDTKTYNSIISVASFLKETGELRWELCENMLKEMNQRQLLPDIGTLNACLYTISTITNQRFAKKTALQVLSEFKKIGIEPCLGSWYYILITFCRERGPTSHVLVDILNEIEGKEFIVRDPKDVFFFVTAMDICRNHLHDKNLAKRVNTVLHHGNNYDLIGDSFKESVYYRHYFALLCQTEPLETFMSIYEVLVPNVYVPEPGVMEEVLIAINSNGALDLLPKIWTDMTLFDHTNRENLLNKVLGIMTENKPNVEISSHQGLEEKFAAIAYDIYTKILQIPEERTNKLTFTGRMLGQILTVITRSGDYSKAAEVFKKLDEDQHKIPGNCSPESILEFVDLCITSKKPSQAINCLQYFVDNGFPDATALAKKIHDSYTLDATQISKINHIVGDDILKTEQKASN